MKLAYAFRTYESDQISKSRITRGSIKYRKTGSLTPPKELGGEADPVYQGGAWSGAARRNAILELWLSGHTMRQVAKLSNCSLIEIARIIGGRTRPASLTTPVTLGEHY